jgi:hypothetical protein
MKATVYLLRKRGRRSARTEEREGVSGELHLSSTSTCTEVRLSRAIERSSNRTDLLPPLYEPVLAALGNSSMLLRGYESIDGAAFVQEWHVLFATSSGSDIQR